MNLFGWQLSLNRNSKIGIQKSGDETPVSQLSPAALAWLRGDDAANGHTGTVSNAYQQVVWVYRAINVLAEQIANIPFLFSAGERGRENLITSGPLFDFYAQPHPQINGFQYWELRVIWLMLRGECMRVPIYQDAAGHASANKNPKSKLKNILILDPSRFRHIVQDNQLIGWRYTGLGPNAPLDSQIFLPEEVWFEKLPNPFDFWRGMPPLLAADLATKTDFAAASFMRGLMENNADLGVIVRTDQPLDATQQEQILADLRNRKARAGTADRPLLLWNGAEVIKPQLSSADMQFLENRKFTRAEICAAFGVPEEILTSTDHSKYDVMAGARLNFIENRVAPLCRRLEAAEQTTIRTIDPKATGWFDLESLPIMQTALRSRIATAKIGFDMGIPFNELNRIFDLGFNPLPWGNTGYLPTRYQPLGQNSSTASALLNSQNPNPSPEGAKHISPGQRSDSPRRNPMKAGATATLGDRLKEKTSLSPSDGERAGVRGALGN